MSLRLELPLKIVSVANRREHWGARHRRAAKHRETAHTVMLQLKVVPMPCRITLTRIGPQQLDDDNLAGAFKAARDGIADRLGVPDNDPRVSWRYAQQHGKGYSASITVEAIR